MKQFLFEMGEKGVINRRTSEYVSAPILHKKRDGSTKIIIDLRRTNHRTVPESYRLPDFQDFLSLMGDKKVYNTIDICGAYHSVELTKKLRKCTTFIAHFFKF